MENQSHRLFRLLAILLSLLLLIGFDFIIRQSYLALFHKHDRIGVVEGKPPISKSGESHPAINPHRVADPFFHHSLRPRAVGWDVFGNTQTEYFVNSAGFRDGSARTVDLASPQAKILILGDSYAEGIGVSWDKTFAGILQREFAPRGVEVLNAAVVSYCPSLMLAKLRTLYARDKLRTDLVVVFLDISDVDDELSYEALPEGGFRMRESSPLSDASFRTWDLRVAGWLEKNFTLLGAASRNLRLFWRRWGSPGGTSELTRGRWPEYRGPGEALIRRGLDRAASSMDGIKLLTDAHQGRLLLVIYPWREQVESGKRPSWMEVFWEDWARRREVELINFFPWMVGMGKKFEKEFCIPGDGHWNAAGHAAVAGRLKKELEHRLH